MVTAVERPEIIPSYLPFDQKTIQNSPFIENFHQYNWSFNYNSYYVFLPSIYAYPFNFMDTSDVSSEVTIDHTKWFIDARDERLLSIISLAGKYAHIPFSSDDFSRQKQDEIKNEED